MRKIISIVGLTASGKSSLGIQIAKEFNGEIISADSRQVYRGLDIGTAKVTAEERALVPHHLIDVVDPPKEGADPHDRFDVFEFQKRAFDAIEEILSRGKLPIIVGGTGLYSRSVVEGFVFSPNGKSLDRNPRYSVLQVCLMPPRDLIRPIVKRRIEERLSAGMIKETEDLIARGVSRGWLAALGLEYFWNIEFIDGRVNLDEYKKNLLTKTMQFAKRQGTWYRREKDTHFLTNPDTYLQETRKLVSAFVGDD